MTPHGEADLKLLYCAGSFSEAFAKLLWPRSELVHCRHVTGHNQVYTFSSLPTVIEAPRIRVSPPRLTDAPKNPIPDSLLQSVDRNIPVTDDSGTECDLDSSQTTAVSVSPDRLESTGPLGSSNVDDQLLGATTSRQSPRQHSILRSSLREIPEDEIRRSGVSKI